jgi:hypothetical protein
MKTIAYTLYVVTILLVSGLARANASSLFDATQAQYQTPVHITQVSPNAAKLQLFVGGSVPNPCFGNPSAMLTQDTSNPTTLILHLSSPIPLDQCVSKVKYFTTVVDLPILAQASLVNLDDKALYLIKMEGFDFQMTVSGSDLK